MSGFVGTAAAAPGGLTYLPGADRCITSLAGDSHYGGTCATSQMNGARDLAMSPDGATVYVVTGDRLVLLRRNATTGALSQVHGTAGCWDTVEGGDCSSHSGVNHRTYFSPQTVVVVGDFVAVGSTYFLDVFRRASDGTLTPVACGQQSTAYMGCANEIDGWSGAVALTAHPSGTRLYGVSGSIAIMMYHLDPVTGAVTQPAGACASTTGTHPTSYTTTCSTFRGLNSGGAGELSISPDGLNLYAGGAEGIASFAIDSDTGSLTQLTGEAGCMGPPDTASAQEGCATRHNAQQLFDIDLTSDGSTVLAVNRESSSGGLLEFDRSVTGALTFGTCFGGVNNANGCAGIATYFYKPYELAIAPQDDSIYTFGSSTSLQGFSRDTATGAITPIDGAEGCVHVDTTICQGRGPYPQPNGILLDPLGKFLYFGGDQSIIAMSRELGAAGVPQDAAGPTISIAAPSVGQRIQQGAVVTAAYTCADELQLVSCEGTVANGARLPTDRLGEFSLRVVARDAAGHETIVTHGYFVVQGGDVTKPVVTIDNPFSGHAYPRGIPVVARYSCTDDRAVVACQGPVASGARIDTSRIGRYSFRVQALDAAGNLGEAVVDYSVVALTAPQAKQEAISRHGGTVTTIAKGAPKSLPATSFSRKGTSIPVDMPKGNVDVKQALLGSLIQNGSNAVAPGGANVIAPGGANLAAEVAKAVAAGGANAVAAGGANVIAPGGANLTARDGRSEGRARPRRARIAVLATGSRYFAKPGKARVKLTLTKQGRLVIRRAFARPGKQKVTLLFAVGVTERGAGLPAVASFRKMVIRE